MPASSPIGNFADRFLLVIAGRAFKTGERNIMNTLRKWESAKGKYKMTAFYDDSSDSYELEHKENGYTVAYQSGMKTACELNQKIFQELEHYRLDNITLNEIN